ncbi:MAG: hypothetical protein JSV83_03100 [Desulfobacterales bacterium]|nr:MAG: hypothetical protein JSV83_03100 [Desulfobacterales bacterium]
MDFKHVRKKSAALTIQAAATIMVILCIVVLGPGLFELEGSQALAQAGDCSNTADEALAACYSEADDDYHIARGNCYNLPDEPPGARDECFASAENELTEAEGLCDDQLTARQAICEVLGEGPYDPEIDPANFVNPRRIGKTIKPNRYFPLVPGTVWEYITKEEGEVIETIEVEVLKETKKILGVRCIVVLDRVWEIDEEGDKSLIEKTHDWYAQDKDGNVWYFGEISQEFEDGELISLEGSWKAGVDGAKAGILMKAHPEEGDLYRQEFALGDAEDMAEVVGFKDSIKVRGKTYKNVLQTREFTPIEPDGEEFKYYAPRVGLVREVNPDGGRVILVKKTP